MRVKSRHRYYLTSPNTRKRPSLEQNVKRLSHMVSRSPCISCVIHTYVGIPLRVPGQNEEVFPHSGVISSLSMRHYVRLRRLVLSFLDKMNIFSRMVSLFQFMYIFVGHACMHTYIRTSAFFLSFLACTSMSFR